MLSVYGDLSQVGKAMLEDHSDKDILDYHRTKYAQLAKEFVSLLAADMVENGHTVEETFGDQTQACLQDVVSHQRAIRDLLTQARDRYAATGDVDNASFVEHEMKAWARMGLQASDAIAHARPSEAVASGGGELVAEATTVRRAMRM
jgi:hypothetical protein